jgi:hypothetical protein
VVSPWWSDDEQLFVALKSALRERSEVPDAVVAAAKAAYAWRTIDAELAGLTYDSADDDDLVLATRAESAPLRALTFASEGFTIELEVTADALHGQLVPAHAGTVEVRFASGEGSTVPINEVGYFVIRPVPVGSFRLRCQTRSGTSVLTGWMTP